MHNNTKGEIILQTDNCLRFDIGYFKKKYKTEYIIEEHQNSKIRITHNAIVETIDIINPEVYLVAVTVNNFLINNLPPDLMLEQLAEKCRKPLEYVVFYVSNNWEIKGIYNHHDIFEKWLQIKEKLQQEYTGDVFEKYIIRHEQVIQNPDLLFKKLKQDVFLSQLFFPLYNEAFKDYEKLNSERVKFLNIEYDLNVSVAIQADETLNDGMAFTILKSVSTDETNVLHMPIVQYNTQYFLDNDMAITAIHGSFENYGRKFFFNFDEHRD